MTITETGVILHDSECWRWHQSCALAEIERLLGLVKSLKEENERLFYAAQDAMKEVQSCRVFLGRKKAEIGEFLERKVGNS